MGKKLVHSAKMSRAVPADDQEAIGYALSLPRSAEVAGTFEVRTLIVKSIHHRLFCKANRYGTPTKQK